MGSQALQASLVGGELAPTLWGRVDIARYQNSLKVCRNFVVYPYGGVKNRAGSRYLGTVKDQTQRCRMIPFSFNTSQTYALEFGNLYMRVWSNGGPVYGLVTNLSAYQSGTTYAVGDIVKSFNVPYQSLQAGNLAHTPASSPTYWAPMNTVTIGGANYYLVEIATPYLTADLPLLKFTQSADVMTIAHPNYPTQQLKRYANDHWTMTAFNYLNGPFQSQNIDLNFTMSVDKATGIATVTASKPVFTTAHVGLLMYLEQKDYGIPWEVGKSVSLGNLRRSDGNYYQVVGGTAGGAGPWTTGTLQPINTVDIWNDGGVNWVFVHPGFGNGLIQPTGLTTNPSATCKLEVKSRLPDSLIPGAGGSVINLTNITIDGLYAVCTAAAFAGVGTGDTVAYSITYTGISGTTTVTGTSIAIVDSPTEIRFYITLDFDIDHTVFGFVSGTVQDISSGVASAPSYKWAFGAWGPSLGYPAAVAYHQQRLVFGNNANQPQTIWMSKTGSFNDFGVSSPVLDDDAVTFTLASTKVDTIKTLMPTNRLMVLTAGGEWVVGNSAQDVITPSNISCILQGYRGASDLPPIGVGNTTIFLQRQAQVVRDLSYQFANDSFTGDDLTVFANHLMEGHQIQEWAYQQIPITCLWAVRDDGVLLGLTYMKEQQIVAWHRHDTPGAYESVCCISEGSEDVLYAIVNRTINGATCRYVERFDTRVVTDIKDGFFVDAGLSYDGRVKTVGGVSSTTDLTGVTVTISGGTLWSETETLNLVASSALFAYPAQTDAGDQLVFMDSTGTIAYRLTIVATTDSTHATAIPNRTLPVTYQNAARSDWFMARNTFSGISHLEGQTVNILADGNTQTSRTVTSGTIVIDPPAYRVHVGLPITADLQTLDLSVPNIETILPKAKAIPAVRILVNESRGIWAGRDFTHLTESKIRSFENYDVPTNLFTGIAPIRIITSWGPEGDLCMRHTTPDPISILALIPEVNVGGVFS